MKLFKRLITSNKFSLFIESSEIYLYLYGRKCFTGKKLNMNTLSYIIYLFITYLITVHVGRVFYKNGRHYIVAIINEDGQLTDFINRILLVGYYLMNLGYATIMLRFWKTITTFTELIASVSSMTGRIVLSLAVMHFVNMYVITIIGKKQLSIHHKK